MLFENVTHKVKVKLSFGHKAVVLLLSKLNIESKNFFIQFAQFALLFENVTERMKV